MNELEHQKGDCDCCQADVCECEDQMNCPCECCRKAVEEAKEPATEPGAEEEVEA
jgi:hypothetical protein